MKRILAIVFLLNAYFADSLHAQLLLHAESGQAFEGYNEVRIPGGSGTKFSFTDDFELKGPVVPFRARLSYSQDQKNHFSVLFAPLTLRYSGEAPYDIRFMDVVFPEGVSLDGLYKFNSYRFTYRYHFLNSPAWQFGLGITAKIRDAGVYLSSEATQARRTNIGFVPLVNFYVARSFGDLSIMLDGDALVGKTGRAEDIFLGMAYAFSPTLGVYGGYRILEGGAGAGSVHNFTLVHFASIGLDWKIFD